MEKLLSIIIPAYNAERSLRNCLGSIVGMDRASLCEVIVIDDGSTDGTARIAAEFSSYGVTVITIPNGGVSKARNVGLGASACRYISFVDADDMLARDYMLMVDMAQSTNADIVCGKLCDNYYKLGAGDRRYSILTGPEALEGVLYQTGISGSVCGKVYDRRVLKDVKFIEGMRYEDLEIMPRIFMNARKVIDYNENVYFYCPNPQSFINTYSPARFDVLRAVGMIFAACQGYSSLEKAARDRMFAANFNMYLLCSQWQMQYPDLYPQAQACWKQIEALRGEVLANPKSRLKNKAGAAVSYLGQDCVKFINKNIGLV